jgi:hypothetical protein
MPHARLSLLLAAMFSSAAWTVHAQTPLGIAAAQGPGPPQPAGTRLTFVCPAVDGRASVHGTDVYTADSGVCAAAVHAGALKLGQPGVVTLVFGGAAASFRGSERNGVTTSSYGAWPNTYTFVTDGTPGRISWQTVWNQIPADFADPITVECPAGGRLGGALWGTDTYTKDSTICLAGVHSGAITAEKGGVVTVTRAPGLRSYAATERFGVRSAEYGNYPDAFTVRAARAAEVPPARNSPPPPSSTPPLSGIGPRTVQVSGFTVVGANAAAGTSAVAPRTVQVAGFTATGFTPANVPNVAPRTVTVPGFTLVGASAPP